MEQKRFELPKHPIKGKQFILVERPSSESVWYLVVEPDKSVPLATLEKDPENPKEVLDAIAQQNGEDWVAQFVMGGFSKE